MPSSNSSPIWVSSQDFLRQLITLLAIASTFLFNLWSNLFPINGENIGSLSNSLFGDVLIIPENYAFIIWGLIYVGLIIFSIYQFRTAQSNNPRLRRGGYWLVAACVAQNLWVVLFLLRQFSLSVVAMAAILISLAIYYRSLEVGAANIPKKEVWRAHIPISIYLGWISVASIVNVAIALYTNNWNGWGFSPVGWTIVMMMVAVLIGIWLLVQRGDIAYPLVLVWALVAIAVKHIENPLLAGSAFSLAAVLAIFSLWQIAQQKRIPPQQSTNSP
ncbi:MAG: tryptophan-rich sensory protein [Leptolyngbyaceae bacterium]|nr:tryptophan-rich sensory protein [Leptolyngbyaceae bacterium]